MPTKPGSDSKTGSGNQKGPATPPSINLPKGGGAIRGIGEKFAANPVSGTGSMTVPIATSPGRSGFGPQLSLDYDSGAGNGPFGFGWKLSVPAITRKTDKGLPQYRDAEELDVYILSGAEDLVPVLHTDGVRFKDDVTAPGYVIHRYRPRIESLFARIERWTKVATGEVHWRSITRDNVTTLYGKDNNSRISDPAVASPANPSRVFSWLVCESYDDKGNAIVYQYAEENGDNVDLRQTSERNRVRSANRYVKRIKYGNRISRLIQPDLSQAWWMFEVVFDYDEDHYEVVGLNPARPEAEQHRFVRASASAGQRWTVRPDAFSSYRSGFEVRSYRRCRRILTFHHIPDLSTVEKGYDGLVRSTEFDYADVDNTPTAKIEEELVHQGSTRFGSFIRRITPSGYVRDDTQPVVVRNGVQYATYLKKSLPPVEFEYSKAVIQDDVIELDRASLENLPSGLDGSTYRWVDLYGEGLPGILTEEADAWFYKRNLSPLPVRHDGAISVRARLAPVELVASKPNLSLAAGQAQLMDLAGDGQPDLVVLNGPMPGLYENNGEEDWQPFRVFTSCLHRDTRDPNLRFVDLDGDGHADVLITEEDAFVWYPSLAEEGFAPANRVAQELDEEKGPRLVFADGTQSIYLADMCGDGLTDLVRIRNGEVCYWPNLGYGRFGAKVTMDNGPWFDHPDQFDQSRVRLADIDGTGTNDIIYLHRDGVRLYFNQSGNRLSEARRITQFPPVDNLSSVMTADLLGNGTACLVWSSPLPGAAGRQIRYIDLMGGTKPHLLIRSINNLGAETTVQYAPSGKFYLADKLAGKPWITRVPFPVHVVERVEIHDHISRNRFVTRFAYHHGYFDGIEREFRGFGLVEQWDTEEFAALHPDGEAPAGANLDASSHMPPVLTRTWFHTGVCLGREHVSDFFAGLLDASDVGEYYREPGLSDAQARALLLDDTILPEGLTAEEEHEACRALKGSMLRQEVYALDGTDRQQHPYAVTEQNFTVRVLQPRGDNRHAVFFTHALESLSYHYERNPADPRIGHVLTLEVDDFGNVLKSAAIGYGRRQPDLSLSTADQARQRQILITYTENRVTNSVDAADDHRTPLPCESRGYELTGLALPTAQNRFTFDEVLEAGSMAVEIDYEKRATAGLEKRLIEHVCIYYRRNNLNGALPLGELQSMALPFESRKLAFTPGLVAEIYGGRENDAMFEAEGRYVHNEGDANWWISSGQTFFSTNPGDAPPQELVEARQHFFLPRRFRDPFHTNAVSTESTITYDDHDLLPQETRDALNNRVTVGVQDYRVLQPALLLDPNRNRSAVVFDALGMVAAIAVMGKTAPAPVEGDTLSGLRANLTQAEIDEFLANPKGPEAATLLAGANSRIVYDLTAFWREPDPAKKPPAFAATLTRETHASEAAPAGGLRIQTNFSYSDGFGREIQKKIQAEPGPAPQRNPDGRIILGTDAQPAMTPNEASPRWVGSGWTVFNNKGKPVRQYEPFFTDTHYFEFELRIGVSSVLFYDPLGRVVATLHPNHTWEKVVFDPWKQETWDVNDTVLVADPKNDPDAGEFFRRLPDADYLPTWHALRTGPMHVVAFAERYPNSTVRTNETTAATKTEAHAATPATAYSDTLGRPFLTIAHNKVLCIGHDLDGTEDKFHTRVDLDIEGNEREVRDAIMQNNDAQGRAVMRYDYDMLGTQVHQASMESGERWVLNDVAGNPLYAWDSRGHQFRTAYDPLRRPTDSFLREGMSAEIVIGRKVYGESRPNPEASNLRGKVVEVRDQAGIAVTDDYDFKGNLLRSHRQLAREYKTTLNWSPTAAAVELEADIFTNHFRYDALNRPTELTTPHTLAMQPNVVRLEYNEANLLERIDVRLRGAAAATPFVTDIDYDAKGQRTLIDHGNGVRTNYEYDSLTLRLSHLKTSRGAEALQDLHYTYDPGGNITRIHDDAQQTIFFRNKRVEPSADYTYDAIYRLIEATGREHLGQIGGAPIPHSHDDAPRVELLHPGDGNVMGTYVERYVYDAVGNFLAMQHRGSDPAHAGWTRDYDCNEPSLLESNKTNNRLSRTTVRKQNSPPLIEPYGHDAHGSMLKMPHLPLMRWDFQDQLQVTSKQVVNNGGTPELTFYVYDAAGQRVRKVTERQTAAGQFPTRKEERLYLGGFEIYRTYQEDGVSVKLERETLHVMDDQQRVALIETRTLDTAGTDTAPLELIRYQLGNHLGSASLELDDDAQIISYEEYSPYGSSTYQATRGQTETPKRYRYTGMERDLENGLGYHGARYCAWWLGKWISCDPIGLEGGINLYAYCAGNCVGLNDPAGTEPKNDKATCKVVPTPALDPSDMDDPAAARHDQVAGELGGWDAAGDLTDFELAIADARGGSSFTFPGDPKGKTIGTGPVFSTVGNILTGDMLRSARALQCTDQAGASQYAWMTKEGYSYVFWSRAGALLDAAYSGEGYSMEPGLGASLLNPVDLLSGAVGPKLIGRGGTAAVDLAAGAAKNEVSAVVDAGAAALSRKAPAATVVLSEAVQRVRLVGRMKQIVEESARIADDAILRGDRLVLGEFLYPKEINSLLSGGRLAAARRGVFIEWRARMMFALDPMIQPHVGGGGYLGLRYVVGKAGARRGFADFFGTNGGLLSGLAIDITSRGAVAKHLARLYLEKGLVLTY